MTNSLSIPSDYGSVIHVPTNIGATVAADDTYHKHDNKNDDISNKAKSSLTLAPIGLLLIVVVIAVATTNGFSSSFRSSSKDNDANFLLQDQVIGLSSSTYESIIDDNFDDDINDVDDYFDPILPPFDCDNADCPEPFCNIMNHKCLDQLVPCLSESACSQALFCLEEKSFCDPDNSCLNLYSFSANTENLARCVFNYR